MVIEEFEGDVLPEKKRDKGVLEKKIREGGSN